MSRSSLKGPARCLLTSRRDRSGRWPEESPGHAAMIPIAYGTAVGNVARNDTRGAFYRGACGFGAFRVVGPPW